MLTVYIYHPGQWLLVRIGHSCLRILCIVLAKYLSIKVSYVTYIEQKGECIIIYCGRPCDEVAERVWPIKMSDGA